MSNSEQPKGPAIDLTPLAKASTGLLGHFVHTWFRLYLVVVTNSLRALFANGLIEGLDRPTPKVAGCCSTTEHWTRRSCGT